MVLALCISHCIRAPERQTHMLSEYVSVLAADSPPTSFFHASWHSRITSTAYFFDLASPEKAKTFCCVSHRTRARLPNA